MGRPAKKRTNKHDKAEVIPQNFEVLEDLVFGFFVFALLLIFSTKTLVHFTLPKLIVLRIGTFFLVLLSIYRLKKGWIHTPPQGLLYLTLALSLWWAFSTFFALHLPTALNGFFGRYNGLITHENFLLLFLMTALTPISLKRLERLLIIFIAALIPVALYSAIQFFQLDPIPWSTRWTRSVSTIGHGVPLAALLGMAIPFVLTFFLESERTQQKIFWGGIFLILSGGMAFSLGRGPWIGTTVALVIVLSYQLFTRPKRLRISALLIVTTGLFLLGGIFLNPEGKGNIFSRITTFVQLGTDTSAYGRILYYQSAFEGIKEHPIMGVGFENFRMVYPRYRIPLDNEIFSDTIPTMVHNGYIQSALTNGIPALILYLLLLGSLFVLFIKTIRTESGKREKNLLMALVASLSGYLVQDLFGWLDIALTPFFWILLGLSLSFADRDRPTPPLLKKTKGIGYIFLSSCAISLLFSASKSIQTLSTDRTFWKIQGAELQTDWEEIRVNLQSALEKTPGDSYYQDLAGTYYIKRVNETGDPEAYRAGVKILENAARKNPYDPYILIHRIDLESKALKQGLIDKRSPFTDWAVKQAKTMDKNNPTVYVTIARLLIREKRYSQALEYIDQAIPLNQKVRGPREWIAAKQGIFYELINRNDPESALKVLQEIVIEFPDDALTYALRGKLYYQMKRNKEALDSFDQALKLDPNNRLAIEGIKMLN